MAGDLFVIEAPIQYSKEKLDEIKKIISQADLKKPESPAPMPLKEESQITQLY